MGCLLGLQGLNAQTPVQREARSELKAGNYDRAIVLLKQAIAEGTGNTRDIRFDLAYAYYVKKDFPGAIATADSLLAADPKDEQAYQLLGMVYTGQENYPQAAQLYQKALQQFPGSGVFYSEYGNLLKTAGKPGEAIAQWETGIRNDPNYSGNYYEAARYYAEHDMLWTAVYGEIFINLESLTARTIEMKDLLLVAYQKLLNKRAAVSQPEKPFGTLLQNAFSKYYEQGNVTAESLTAFRTKFILEWFANGEAAKYPFRLFDHMKQLIENGLFEAYNQWIFGAAESTSGYQNWMSLHKEETQAFQAFQQKKVFKVPAMQYYK
jgi:tetratricopeptide (TPR) repeat protein